MDKEKYIANLKILMRQEQEDEESICAACSYAENLIDLRLPVIFNKEHFSLLVGCEVSEMNILVR